MITHPELCLLTYRYVPFGLKAQLPHASHEQIKEMTPLLNTLTRYIQKTQRENGRSFVSRTKLTPAQYGHEGSVVFRTVLANPLTTETMLQEIIAEQRELASHAKNLMQQIKTTAEHCGLLVQEPSAL